jgi:hypothetical protein
MSQGNSLCNYLKQKKMSLFYKTGEQKGKTGPVWKWGDWYQWEGEDIRKEYRRMNRVEILCTQIRKWKNDSY